MAPTLSKQDALRLAFTALAFDALLVFWETDNGIQPVLMPNRAWRWHD